MLDLMKNLTILLSLIILSCNNPADCYDNDERMRRVLAREAIRYMTCIKLDSIGHESISSIAINNEHGDLVQITYYSDKDSTTEKYTYDNQNRITKVHVSQNGGDWRLKMKNTYDDINKRETNLEYAENGTVYRTEYLNNSNGKNISNRHYVDDQLKNIHLFYWTDNCLLDSIVRLDADSNKTEEKMIMKYDNNLLISKTKHKDSQMIEMENFEYNEQGLIELTIYEIPNEYRQSTSIKYKGELPEYETMIYQSLTDDYSNTTKYKWKYK